jgi:hypothetical protein
MRHCVLLTAFLAFLALAALADQAQAENPRGYNFFVAGEYAFAVSPEVFTDYYTAGYGFSLGIEYPASPNWSIIGLFDLKFFNPDGDMIADWWTDPGEYPGSTNIDVSEGSLTAGSIAFLGKGSLKTEGSRFFPYIKGGFGITIAGADEIKVMYDNAYDSERETAWQAGAGNETNLCIMLGLGVEKVLGNGNSSFFIDGGLHMILQENSNPTLAPITLGFKF